MSLSTDLFDLFDQQLFQVASNPHAGVFNPYNTKDPSLDAKDAPLIRCDNLKRYLAEFTQSPRLLLVGEAPGWRGARFSGVPFTDEDQLVNDTLPFSGAQSSSAPQPHTEASASIIWGKFIEHKLHPRAFLWNAFPLHPHERNNLKSNRSPTTNECRQFQPLLDKLIQLLSPEKIIAVGRAAEDALSRYKVECVRHPAHGGRQKFCSGIDKIARTVA